MIHVIEYDENGNVCYKSSSAPVVIEKRYDSLGLLRHSQKDYESVEALRSTRCMLVVIFVSRATIMTGWRSYIFGRRVDLKWNSFVPKYFLTFKAEFGPDGIKEK